MFTLSGGPEPGLEQRLHAVRIYTKWSLLLSVLLIAFMPLFGVFSDGFPVWWRVAVIAVQLVFLVLVARLTARGMSEYGCVRPSDPHLLATLGLSLVSCALLTPVPNPALATWAMFSPAAATSAAAMLLPRRIRWVQVMVISALTIGVGVVVRASTGAAEPRLHWLVTVAIMLVAAGISLTQAWLWDVTEQVNAARATESELAVANERLRFAADLHDVLGHSLEVIAMKAELAVRLPDDERARATMAEVRQTAHDALSEVRDVVRGYRRVDLPTELGGIRSLLEAAGIACAITGSLPSSHQSLFGAVLREAVTNVLRHAAATRCEITFNGMRVSVLNDGVSGAGQDGTGTGLTGLAARVHAVGGQFTAGAEPGGTFRVSASLPEDES